MRFRIEREHKGILLRCWGSGYHSGEIAYALLGLRGPRLDIEFPSDWHEHRRAWIRIGLGFISAAFSFPWRWTVPDQGQCSGPTYGFYCFGNALVLEYGKDTGRNMRKLFIYAPWSWWHVRHSYLNPDGSLHHHAGSSEYEPPAETKQTHPYTYVRRNGEVQNRIATINGEEREWRWRWLKFLPWPRKVQRTINISFDHEVGEESGSWKGGVMGTGYDWRRGESMEDALRRFEREVKL